MIGGVAVLKANRLQWIVYFLVILACTTFWGLGFSKSDEHWHNDALTTRYKIIVNPLGTLQGAVIGFLLAAILYQLHHILQSKDRNRKEANTLKEILWGLGFLLFAFLIFSFLVIIQFEQKEPLNSLIIKIVYKYSALFALLSSWALIGRKMVFFLNLEKTIGRSLNTLFRAPYKTQKIILAFTLLTLLFFCFFPPWKAYESEVCYTDTEDTTVITDRELIGRSTFAGFHFLTANQWAVCGESIYVGAKIDRTFQIILLIATSFLGLYLCLTIVKSDKK